MRSSRIKQNNDWVLVQKEHTGKNLPTKRNLLQPSEVGMANPQRRWVDRNLWLTDRWWWGPGSETLPRLGTLTGEVSNLPTVEARKPYPSRLRSSMWSSQPRLSGRTWGHLLRWTLAPLQRSVDQAVLGWSAPIRPRQRPLLPLLLQASTTCILLLNRSAHHLIQGAAPKQRQVLTQHRTEPLAEKQHLLLIGIGVVGVVLREVVELLAVLIHTARTLLQVQELLKLASHQAHKDVVPTKSRAEFGPWHLVPILNASGEVSPPSTRGSMKLLGHK
jgi:hypothetical protein